MTQNTPEETTQRTRQDSVASLRQLNILPYSTAHPPSHTTAQARDILAGQDSTAESQTVSLVGRVAAQRMMGKAAFVDLRDGVGTLQLYVRRDELGEQFYDDVFRPHIDLGDYLYVRGFLFVTRTGEPCLHVQQCTLLTKSVRSLPVVKSRDGEVFDDVSDPEFRYRQRYVDLAIHPDVREVFVQRARIISHLRRLLEEAGYIEVETPVLQPVYGGAHARPFTTHHNSLNMPLYLRISNELYLKRLIVGGFDGVFEIGKDFRNEGFSRYHNPEFTMIELYVANRDYRWMLAFTQSLIRDLATHLHGRAALPLPDGQWLEMPEHFAQETFYGAIETRTGLQLRNMTIDGLAEVVDSLGLSVEPDAQEGRMLDVIFSAVVEPTLIEATFIVDYPRALSPLARAHDDTPDLVARFELFMLGKEVGNAFSELNDPQEQRRRLEVQAELRNDEEHMMVDEDYLRALEYGMPPTAGLGIGIDRLVMMLLGQQSIKEVILFPQLRPEST